MSVDFLFPPGRMVWGSVDIRKTHDRNGSPLVIKTGPNAGQPTSRIEFGVAIPKNETDWKSTNWGVQINNAALAGFMNGETSRPDFSWKVVDGDSDALNQSNIRWCDKEGYPGHWVVAFGTSLDVRRCIMGPQNAPVICGDGEIMLGYYVEVYANVCANNANNVPLKPGVYINPSIVCRVGYGERIISGPNVTEVGFGAAPIPQGASQIPLGSAGAQPQVLPPQAPNLPSQPVIQPPPINNQQVGAPVQPGAAMNPPQPTVVQPQPAILNPPQQ